ncbi:Myb-like dna-binding protein, partial [Globisporangium splendens]
MVSTAKSTPPSKTTATTTSTTRRVWSEEEHDKFLIGIKLFPKGPWRMIAAQVGTRTPRQVQTHAQKYYEKVARRMRGLRKDRKKLMRPEHRLDEDMAKLCKVASTQDAAVGSRIGAPILGCGLNAVSSPMGVDTVTTSTEDAVDDEFGAHPQDDFYYSRPESFVSLLTDDNDSDYSSDNLQDLAGMWNNVKDSDEVDSVIMDLDDHCLDYLMEVLDAPTLLAARSYD